MENWVESGSRRFEGTVWRGGTLSSSAWRFLVGGKRRDVRGSRSRRGGEDRAKNARSSSQCLHVEMRRYEDCVARLERGFELLEGENPNHSSTVLSSDVSSERRANLLP